VIRRLRIANLPTPLHRMAQLGERLGIDLWVKRDDASGGPEAGNKIRKLEYLLADAQQRGCDAVITCGGTQSNHARATAVAAAALGMRAHLLLRAEGDPALTGNLFIDRMVGADVRFISRDEYAQRDSLMAAEAQQLRDDGATPYIIPEGGSNGTGAMGYVEAMAEVRRQIDDAGERRFDVIVHACGSGGTAAGVALGAARHDVADELVAMAVCDDSATFERRIAAIIDEARQLTPELVEPISWQVDDRYKGSAYAVSSAPQRACMVEVARRSGLLLDPVYSGKAFHGLWQLSESGRWADKRVLFIHTGGLPGLMAQTSSFSSLLA